MRAGTKAFCVGAAALGVAALVRSANRKRYSFRGRSVLITGGSRGLGLELARMFAAEGAHISIIGRNLTTLQAAERILGDSNNPVLTISCDIRNQDEVQAAVRQVISRWGGIDVLVNNAGVIQVGPYEQMTIEDYENALATHLWGPLFTTLEVLPHMRRQRSGRIVNIVSIGGKIGVPHLLPYSASKFALAGFSEALTAEIDRDGIYVTTVFPGLMRTGSHVNARFKGNHRKEFAWFSIAASMPILSINSRRAASQIVEATRRGRRTLVMTPTAKLAVLAHGIFPALVTESLHLTNALLPNSNGNERTISHTGRDSVSAWSPSLLTRLGDKAAERNNEQLHPGVFF